MGLAGDDKSPVIVEINGSEEHKTAFERFIKARLSDFANQNALSPDDISKTHSNLLDEFIRRQLIVNDALKRNIKPSDDEMRQALEDQHKQTSAAERAGNNSSQPALEGAERRIEIFNDLLMLKFIQELGKDVTVKSQDIEAYYNANKDKYQRKNGFYVREIRVHEEASAEKIYRLALAKPGDFAVLAKENSEAPTADSGGLFYYEAQELPEALEQAISPLKVGSISKVVKSDYGFHIFKLEQRADPESLDNVRKEIEDKLLGDKRRDKENEFNDKILKSAKIRIYKDRLGFNYTGPHAGT